jgi:hypothetical protein
MRWFRLGLGNRNVEHDPGRRDALLHDIRERFGPHVQGRFGDQADAITRVLDGDDGLSAAAEVLREFAETAYMDLRAQAADLHRQTGRGFAVDRRNYRPLWQAAGAELRWPLFGLPGGLHPYIQVAASVTVLGGQAKRAIRVTDPDPLLAQVFEVLDLTLVGWEFGRVRVDADYAGLAGRLISTARDLRDAMGDPPPLPPPVRELMRRNNTLDVHDAIANRIIGGFNPGKTMREALLA